MMSILSQASCFPSSSPRSPRKPVLQKSAVDVSATEACIPKVKAEFAAKLLVGVMEAKRASASRWAWILRAVLSYS